MSRGVKEEARLTLHVTCMNTRWSSLIFGSMTTVYAHPLFALCG